MKRLLIIASFAIVSAIGFAQTPQMDKAKADAAKKAEDAKKVQAAKKVETVKKVETAKTTAVDKYHDNVDDRMKGPKGEKVFIGPNGGRYYLTPAGNKVYVPLKKAVKKP